MMDLTLRSGGLAIRYYERIGVLPKTTRTASGYRVYPVSAVNRVLVVQRALRIGFTLSELADIFKTREGRHVVESSSLHRRS